MNTDSPKEYITLITGEEENFSEVFGYRLPLTLWLPMRVYKYALLRYFVCFYKIHLYYIFLFFIFSSKKQHFFLFFVLLSRLMDPTQCPSNLSRREDCQCRRDYTAAGLSTFTRVRMDLGTMTIISKPS